MLTIVEVALGGALIIQRELALVLCAILASMTTHLRGVLRVDMTIVLVVVLTVIAVAIRHL